MPYSAGMKLTQHCLGIITPDVAASREFYCTHFGFQVVYESDWYIHLRHAQSGMELGFLRPNHPSQAEVFRKPFNGEGIWINLEVEDVDAEYTRLSNAGLSVVLTPKDEPWGERHFALLDPHGIGLKIMKMMRMPEAAAVS